MAPFLEPAKKIEAQIEQSSNGKAIEAELEQRTGQRCTFCHEPGLITVDDSPVVICRHCFNILRDNMGPIQKFLGCP